MVAFVSLLKLLANPLTVPTLAGLLLFLVIADFFSLAVWLREFPLTDLEALVAILFVWFGDTLANALFPWLKVGNLDWFRPLLQLTDALAIVGIELGDLLGVFKARFTAGASLEFI